MQPHGGRFGLVKEKDRHRLAHIRASLRPSVALGENVMRQALGHITAVAFLRNAKDDFHAATIARKLTQNKPRI